MYVVSRNVIIGIGVGLAIIGLVIAMAISGGSRDNIENGSTLKGTIKIGVLLPITGVLEEESKGAVAATELSIKDFNEYLESIDAQWRFETVLEDTEANPDVAREKIELLYSQGINVVIGPATSAATAAVKDFADDNDLLVVSCCSSAHSLAVQDDNILRLVPSDKVQGASLVQVIGEHNIDAIVPIWRDDVWGNDLIDFTRTAFEERGIVVSDGIIYDPSTPNPSESISMLADEVTRYSERYGSTKTAVIFMGFDEVIEFVRAATQHSVLYDVPWFGTTALTKNVGLVQDPDTSKFMSDVQFTTISMAESHNSLHNKVRDHIIDNDAGTPSIFAYASYDVPQLIGEAILEIESTDTKTLRDSIIAKSSTFSGAMDTSTLNSAGDLAMSDFEVWSIIDGEWIQTGQYMHKSDSVEMSTFVKSELDGSIPIGVLVATSGDLSSIGEEAESAIKFAADDFNKHLAELGQDWTMDLVIEDTQTNPVIALEKTTSFNAKGINVIVGPSTSAALKNIKGYADANNLVLISYSSTAPSLALANDSIYRTIPDDKKQGPAIANLLYEKGVRAAVIMYRADTWGDGLLDTITESFTSLGGIVGKPIRYSPTNQEFSVSVSVLAEEVQTLVDEYGTDEVAVVIVGFAETLQIIQSASQEDILDDVLWFGTDAVANDIRITNDPIGREFVIATEFTTLQFASSDNPTTAMVRDKVLADIGRTPSVYAYTAYDAVWLAGLSILESQSTETDDITSTIMSVADDRIGAAGPNKLNAAGDLVAADYDILTTVDGDWSTIGRYNSADSSIDWNTSESAGLSGEISIGVLASISGDTSFLGEEVVSSVKLARDDFNKYLAESDQDWTMDLVIEDTQTNPVIALEKTTSFKGKGINVIVGPATSASVKNVKGYTDANNMLVISYSSSAPSLALVDDSIYRTVADDQKQGPALAAVMRDRGIDAIVIMYRADAWGDDLHESTTSSFRSLGGMVDKPIRYDPKLHEFSVSVSVLADEVQTLVDEYGSDRVAVVLMGFIESLQIMQSAAQEDILDDVRWFGTNANTNIDQITNDLIGRDFATATKFTSLQLAPDNNSDTKRVTDTILQDLGRTPTVYAYTAYDAVWLAGLSMLESQSTETDDIKSVIMSVADDRIGAVGPNRLNAAGDLATADYDIWTAVDGEWSIIGTYLSADKSVTWK